MAAVRINPLDLKPSVAIGVSIPFNGPAVFNSTYTTKDQIRSNLINFFLTDQGERVFNIPFGLGLRRKIFEQITNNTISDIRNTIIDGLERYFPRVILNDLQIDASPDYNRINIVFSYSVIETNITDTVSLSFDN